MNQVIEVLRNFMRECYLKHNAADLRDVICISGRVINKSKLWEYRGTFEPLLASVWSDLVFFGVLFIFFFFAATDD